jgi:hypothetical protein
MKRKLQPTKWLRMTAWLFLVGSMTGGPISAQTAVSANTGCRVEAVDYKGWQAQQLTNRWEQLIVVPQNGGRLMQVTFAGHAYLFVNPKLAGKYLPPSNKEWFNYGGDKLWLLPEGNTDEQHWVGNSDAIDDTPFSFRKLSEGEHCEIELTSQADPLTGIQFQRTIRLGADSPEISFHATMKNITGHRLEWSMQSVSQYNTGPSPDSGSSFNRDFWTFTPTSPASSYLNRYHVRTGLAENPAIKIREDGLFTLHYIHMASELWIDSPEGWLAVVDGSSRYGMVERFQYEQSRPYPGKASVIFWMNGPGVRVGADGEPSVPGDSDGSPYYLEAELNSPLCRLAAGENCTFDTKWFPTRTGDEFHGVSDAGIIVHPLRVTRSSSDKLDLSGSFGVFFSGHLVARLFDPHGSNLGTMNVSDVNPTEPVVLHTEITPPGKVGRVSLHLVDANGVDRGSLEEVRVSGGEAGPTEDY